MLSSYALNMDVVNLVFSYNQVTCAEVVGRRVLECRFTGSHSFVDTVILYYI